ncbi:CBS domain-containing protein [Komagataeibacter sp. FNDCR2]|uniref:CBS domain-containing protein n=1 Tax=Komagataeibacter sp. FNDCR2 TaxID=2878682 RepID=UPI001E4D5053|nr:CBS domain-containing protein [Komagataeibacter sp. FNDCR2]MCE2575225.1 CBS domain-containing protein [Komagataeibacter sp. FNDCR2]
MQIKNIMTAPAISIEPTETITTALRLMLSHKISGLPVVTPNGQLVGVLTEGDLMRRSELQTEKKPSWIQSLLRSSGKHASEYVHTHGRRVSEIMSNEPVTISPEASLHEAVDMMTRHHVRRLPVVRNERLVGVVSRADMLRALLPVISDEPRTVADETIKESILREYRTQDRWAGGNFISVDVKNGIVELNGVVTDERLRVAARVVAENVPGVVSVIDNMTFVEPFSSTEIPPPLFP